MTERRPTERDVSISIGPIMLEATLAVPADARAIVLFAHGSGSSRHSVRNRCVAQHLEDGGLATLLTDLLTLEEEATERYTGHLRFDIELLSRRLIGATDWIRREPVTRDMAVGYFGASTGAAAALIAATERPDVVHAIVSRGGRPDLAGDALSRVGAPTLLIVGGADQPVVEMNRAALRQLRCLAQLEIVPRATHLFEEPGALDEVARMARAWFERFLSRRAGVAA